MSTTQTQTVTTTVEAPKPKLRYLHISDGKDAILKVMQEDGGVVIREFLTAEQTRQINRDIDAVIDKIVDGGKHADSKMRDFHGLVTKRMTNLPTHSKTFRDEVLNHKLLHEICEDIFRADSGDYWMNTAQVIDIGPGNVAQPLHRDQMQYAVFSDVGSKTKHEATINFFVALTEFTDENGATRIIPGSHIWPDHRDYGTQEQTIPALMHAGDVTLFSGKTSHGGGANRTKDFRRRGIALSMQASYLTPEEAYPFIVPREIVETMTPLAQRMIAWRSQYPVDSGGLWQSDYCEIADVLGLKAAPPVA
ncbi:hypothetical protein A1O1_06041 [Capronia coronata CBS 617.96]|uniref:Phytanoyl-CoA dioxygenase n=1 Tax=Capronia coronata CBS 617.96 TaxID=1182541 RepID=W9Y7Q8_9EURO|nr:uncharacterized protein A1O1_06041 [Capronia coronata CBS 617.96]EXJ85675.1 hypothetical protein A1O1_06041 [Capronia coronata CBS 617.96]